MSKSFKYTHDVLIYPLGLVLLIWIVYWIEIKYNLNFTTYGIYPQKIEGLKGIIFSTFIHSSLKHLFNNSVPLLLLSMALFYFYRKISKPVILWGIFITGLLTWLIGRPSYHIGASGLVYVLASFLFFKGIFSKYYRLVALSLSVVFIYGSLVWGLFPGKVGMSWEGHLSGFVVGLGLAFVYKTNNLVKPKYEWEKQDYNAEEDEFMQLFDDEGNFNPDKNNDDQDKKDDEINVIYHIKKNKDGIE
ncbi:rhomboid family intramembrane serine protease [Psychroflexus sp. MBR-150]|jgi:membrane associated rhomboid family serine protease